jgi:hypothetical protein
MKQVGYSKRPRGRSFERRPPRNTSRETTPEIRGRGNPQQSVDKYLSLAREAASSGDPVSAESYYQYADHYYRLVVALRPPRPIERQPEISEEIPPATSLENAPPELLPQP